MKQKLTWCGGRGKDTALAVTLFPQLASELGALRMAVNSVVSTCQ